MYFGAEKSKNYSLNCKNSAEYVYEVSKQIFLPSIDLMSDRVMACVLQYFRSVGSRIN
mgnify:CR=1 FL=1